eukprot:3625450-Rhodomonas_salina.2
MPGFSSATNAVERTHDDDIRGSIDNFPDTLQRLQTFPILCVLPSQTTAHNHSVLKPKQVWALEQTWKEKGFKQRKETSWRAGCCDRESDSKRDGQMQGRGKRERARGGRRDTATKDREDSFIVSDPGRGRADR